jgi:hypothetical protein
MQACTPPHDGDRRDNNTRSMRLPERCVEDREGGKREQQQQQVPASG